MAGSTGLEPATSGLTERGEISEVARSQSTISMYLRNCVSLRWLGGSLDLLPRAARSSRFCHVFMASPDWARSRRIGLPIDLLAVVSHLAQLPPEARASWSYGTSCRRSLGCAIHGPLQPPSMIWEACS